MLHMVVNSHNPESCAFRGQDEGRILSEAFDRLDELAAKQGAIVKGSWVNRGAHEIFVLVDAPNAHVIEEALLGAGLVGRTHSRVLSVVSTEDVDVDTGEEQPR
jgi:hypothetical protein